jgi:chitin disaccharide deacetylase
VNADDFGYTDGINSGIIEAHTQGVVTSASLMVKQTRATQAAELASLHPRLGLGLHVDLADWEPAAGEWKQRYARVDETDSAQVASEIAEQLEIFIQLIGRPPDHIDSHQHVHLVGPPRDECLRVARSLNVPLRGLDARVATCLSFYGQSRGGEPFPEATTLTNLVRLIDDIGSGWTELMCHPGRAHELDSVYGREREQELAVLCHPDLPAELRMRQVELRSFSELSD